MYVKFTLKIVACPNYKPKCTLPFYVIITLLQEYTKTWLFVGLFVIKLRYSDNFLNACGTVISEVNKCIVRAGQQ